MTTIPDFLPVLSAGAHSSPKEGACFMEWASILAGEEFTDSPACSHPVLTRLAQAVNDRLADSERHKIAHLIPSVIGTADTREDRVERKRLSVRLAVWCARQVAHLSPDPRVGAALAAAEAWTEDPSEGNRAAAAAAAGDDAAYGAVVAASAASAAYAASANYAAHAAAHAAYAYAAYGDGLIALLEGAIAEHKRLTNHNPTPINTTEWEHARQAVQA